MKFKGKFVSERRGALKESKQGELLVEETWIQFEDPTTGREYWHNSSTSETTWDEPLGVQAALWVKIYDPDHGKPFYYCKTTEETRWEAPI